MKQQKRAIEDVFVLVESSTSVVQLLSQISAERHQVLQNEVTKYHSEQKSISSGYEFCSERLKSRDKDPRGVLLHN